MAAQGSSRGPGGIETLREGLVQPLIADGHQIVVTLTPTAAAWLDDLGSMGHVSVNAALVYQHRTASRDRAIADSPDAMVAALNAEARDRSGHVGGTARG
jgi:hypothetical protein